MPKKRKRREIVVAPPALRPREEALLRDTTGVEALDVSKVSVRIGKYLSLVMIIVGAFFCVLSIYSIMISSKLLLSSPFFLGALGFLGAINIFCGLILLAKE
ncbi:MAG: hypothetical protein ACE5L6_03930 [Candidatus Bathyarchaeia archaeon]